MTFSRSLRATDKNDNRQHCAFAGQVRQFINSTHHFLVLFACESLSWDLQRQLVSLSARNRVRLGMWCEIMNGSHDMAQSLPVIPSEYASTTVSSLGQHMSATRPLPIRQRSRPRQPQQPRCRCTCQCCQLECNLARTWWWLE